MTDERKLDELANKLANLESGDVFEAITEGKDGGSLDLVLNKKDAKRLISMLEEKRKYHQASDVAYAHGFEGQSKELWRKAEMWHDALEESGGDRGRRRTDAEARYNRRIAKLWAGRTLKVGLAGLAIAALAYAASYKCSGYMDDTPRKMEQQMYNPDSHR